MTATVNPNVLQPKLGKEFDASDNLQGHKECMKENLTVILKNCRQQDETTAR